MYKLSFCLILLCIGYVVPGFSQTDPVWIIKGKIVNATTGAGLEATTISIPNKRLLTISNGAGFFVLKVPVAVKTDSLYVTCVGFAPQHILLRNIPEGDVIIKLTEQVTQLKDVVIKAINPLDIIQQAISKIPENYNNNPHVTRGFYRLATRKSNEFIHLSEAVFDLYNTRSQRKFKLLKARMEKDLSPFKGVSNVVFGLKPENVYEYDIVNNIQQSEVLGKKGLADHRFSLQGIINYNGREAYEITFDQKEGIRKALYKGKMYIDVDNLAFLAFNYCMSPKGIKYWEVKGLGQKALMKLLNIYETVLQDTIVINYQNIAGKYYLSHVQENSVVRVNSARIGFDFNACSQLNYLVTHVDTTLSTDFDNKDLLGAGRYIEYHSSNDTSDFWKDYNLIPADYNIDSVAKTIQKRNGAVTYKRDLENKLRKYAGKDFGGIDTVLSFYHRNHLFNGIALVKYKGVVIYHKPFGLADVEKNIPVDQYTQFRIGSVSKQFTAMLIMQLENDGRLNLNDSIGKFLPGFVHGKVTIEQLLTHRSGIPSYTLNMGAVYQLLTHRYTITEVVQQFCSDSLEFESDSSFRYSNSGYTILSAVIEKVTGKYFGDVLAENIFKPLGMKHTFFGTPLQQDSTMAKGYEHFIKEPFYYVENMAGAGGITSTAADLLLWENALHTGQLLPEEKIAALFKPRAVYNDWGAWYGYGWMIDRLQFAASRKHVVQYHPGTDYGFYSMLVRQPDKDIAIILLSNNGDFPRFDMTDLMLQVLNEKH